MSIARLFLLPLLVALSGCGESSAPATRPDATAPAKGVGWKEIKPSADYPLTTCVVSGEKLGSGGMGPPVAIEYQGAEIQFCCKECLPEFEKDPERYVAQVRAAKK
jgi:hypothetical protein